MAETLLSFGVQKLWDLLVRESERLQGFDKQLTELKSNLNLLRSFLKDADAKKHASATVGNFVEEIKEIVFDTEDIIEIFILKEEVGKPSGIKQHMRRFSCIIGDRRTIASDIEDMSKRISKVIRDMKSFGVQQMIVEGGVYSHPVQERQKEMRKTFSSNNEKNLVGLDENVKKLVGYLVKKNSIQVISITGMGGIGKTTLARQAFNHEMVKNHFDNVVWVCISQQFTRKYVWETIFRKLGSKHDKQRDSNMSEDELQEKLFRLLETSNSLIILDDIWKEEDWDMIKHVFPPNKEWKVLLTSRNDRVALRADPTCVTIKPQCLTSEESWTLFQKIAFPISKDIAEHKVVEMEKTGKQMIKHCGGLPLAINVLGGLLAAQHTLSEWKRVCENIGSHIVGRTSFMSSIYHILDLSFEELPFYLKHCFLYLAHFPQDHKINAKRLAYVWAVEGISGLGNYGRTNILDVADHCIEELVIRNMVISERDMLTSRFKFCQLHDMMRDVCLRKAKDEKFLHIVPGTSTTESESRRLVIHTHTKTFNVEGEMKNPKLRSLLFIRKHNKMMKRTTSELLFTRLQLLRVLDLTQAKFEERKLPSSIGNLIHLRYLSLFLAELSHLPSSMRNLKKLLYLNLRVFRGYPMYMTNFMNDMLELEYLALPEVIHDKVKMDLGNLVKLETLMNFSTKHSNVKDLCGMTRLETLSINYNGGCTMETLSLSLNGLDCVHLKQLEMIIQIPKLFDEQTFLTRLTAIHLHFCLLEEDPMPILEKLLQLKELRFSPLSFCGRRMVCSSGGFPKLQDLTFSMLKEWEEWILEEGSMAILDNITIYCCSKLKQLPDGMRSITSLKRIEMYTIDLDMKKEWKKRMSEGGEDYYKVQHISSVKLSTFTNE